VKKRIQQHGSRDIIDRMMLRLLNEVVACLREGVVADADLLDGGMIYGTGFAPFHGGPLNYIRCVGADTLFQRLQDFEQRFGVRFTPDAGWDKVAGFTDPDDSTG
jgi:3-hydroxyacyl-CoA dehydrogenase/enoyl-CoA hydratase/3-hydroxybutyryl-CoA epimerase